MTGHQEAVAVLEARTEKQVLLPGAARFDDVFAGHAPWRQAPDPLRPVAQAFPPSVVHMQNEAVGRLYAGVFGRRAVEEILHGNTVGPFCSVQARGARWSLAVQASDRALAVLAARIVTPEDRLGFKIIGHESGYALVICEHTNILGSHWLAYIDPASIPGGPS